MNIYVIISKLCEVNENNNDNYNGTTQIVPIRPTSATSFNSIFKYLFWPPVGGRATDMSEADFDAALPLIFIIKMRV